MSEERDPVAEAWEKLLDEWNDADAHKRFLTLADSLDRLGDAGTRYRAIKDEDPSRAEVADAQITRVLGLALARLAVLKTERERPRKFKSAITLVAMGVSGALILWTLLGLLRSL